MRLTRPNSGESNGSMSRDRPNGDSRPMGVEGIEILKKVSSIKSIAGNDQVKPEATSRNADKMDPRSYMGLLSENMILRKESDRKDELISKLTNMMETQGSSNKRISLGTIRLEIERAEPREKDPFRHSPNVQDLPQATP